MKTVMSSEPVVGGCPPWCDKPNGHGWEDEWPEGFMREHVHLVGRLDQYNAILVHEYETATAQGAKRIREVTLDVEAPTQLDVTAAGQALAFLAEAVALVRNLTDDTRGGIDRQDACDETVVVVPTNDSSAKEAVDRAIAAGYPPDSLDMVTRARYACEWGNGDALHQELADEVEQLRTVVRQHATREDGTTGGTQPHTRSRVARTIAANQWVDYIESADAAEDKLVLVDTDKGARIAVGHQSWSAWVEAIEHFAAGHCDRADCYGSDNTDR